MEQRPGVRRASVTGVGARAEPARKELEGGPMVRLWGQPGWAPPPLVLVLPV